MPLNIPNALTMLRILAVPVVVVALLGEIPNGDLWAGIVFAIAAFTDGLVHMVAKWDANPSARNEALMAAFIDCRERCQEEAKRHEAELEMRREWAERQPTDSEAWS